MIARRRPIPVILQMTIVECGAACLAMVLHAAGRAATLEECRDLLMIGRDGVSAAAIADAAAACGLEVAAYRLDADGIPALALPAIVHWEHVHFVVVARWSARRVEVLDPAVGRRWLTPAEFAAGFSGVAMTFRPGPAFEPRAPVGGASLRPYLRLARQAPGLARLGAQIVGAALLLQAVGLALPLLTRAVVDEVLPLRRFDWLMQVGGGLALLLLLYVATMALRTAALIRLQTRVDAHVMERFFAHVLALPLPFFQRRTSGDVVMRLGSNAVIREILTNTTLAAALDGALVLGYLLILLVWHAPFGLAVAAIGLLQALAVLLTARRMQVLSQQTLAAESAAHAEVIEAIQGIATLKAAGAETHGQTKWLGRFRAYQGHLARQSALMGGVSTVLATLSTFAPLVLLWLGAVLVLEGGLSLGTMLALNALGLAVLGPLASVIQNGQQLVTVGAYLARIADVLAAAPEQPEPRRQPPTLTGALAVESLSFRYTPHAPPVLSDVSFEAAPGQRIAIVGPTGSGKSTLALLLLGLYEPTAGTISYDGEPLAELDYRAVRRQIGAVLQQGALFRGTIRENIAFHRAGLAQAEIEAAARAAAIHDDIAAMPMGYDTLIADSSGLSGGQRQRLMLARALAGRPAILLLDEATSHLDGATETLVSKNLAAVAATQIVIAHRLSTIMDAELILVLNNGRLIAHGTHDRLLEQSPLYAELVRHAQLAPASLTDQVPDAS